MSTDLEALRARARASKGATIKEQKEQLKAVLTADPPKLDTSKWVLPEPMPTPPGVWVPRGHLKPKPKPPSRWSKLKKRFQTRVLGWPKVPSLAQRQAWLTKSADEWRQWLAEHGDEED